MAQVEHLLCSAAEIKRGFIHTIVISKSGFSQRLLEDRLYIHMLDQRREIKQKEAEYP